MLALGSVCFFSALYWAIAWRDVRHWLREPGSQGSTREMPITFFCPLKPGAPALREKLELLVGALDPGDQLLLGVDAGSPEAARCEEVRARATSREVCVMPCAPGAALNPKISKLLQMTPAARHERWVLSDSEALLDAHFLRALRAEWQTCEGDVLTFAYRFRGATTWPQRLDAAGVLLNLWPGLALVRARSPVRFTLGACLALHRADVEAIGGWAALGDQLAEDHQLGARLAKMGRRIRLSREVVTLAADSMNWRDYWRHQRRVAVTYRVANPAGFAGTWLVQGVSASLLLALLLRTWPGWMVFAGVLAWRVWTASRMARLIGWQLGSSLALVFLASLVESVCWLAAWLSPRVWWAGREWCVTSRGRLVPIKTAP